MKMCITTINLHDLRRSIDGVDTAIALLLRQRRRLSRAAIRAKTRIGLPVLDRVREEEIEHRYEQAAPGSGQVIRTILLWCRGGRREH